MYENNISQQPQPPVTPDNWDERKKNERIQMLKEMYDKANLCYAKSKILAEGGDRVEDLDEIKNGIENIASTLSKYIGSGGENDPMVLAYKLAQKLKYEFSLTDDKNRAELRQVATFLNEAELQETGIIKGRAESSSPEKLDQAI